MRVQRHLLAHALVMAGFRQIFDDPKPRKKRTGTPPNPHRKNKAQKKAEKRQRQQERNNG